MANLQDIIKLTEHDGGKVFVIDEKGGVKMVVLSIDDYQRLLLGKLREKVRDVEQINREITLAQLEETVVTKAPDTSTPPVEVISETNDGGPARVDLRSEVVDPNFNFDAAPGDEYEAIKPDFDDI